jgi:hypothetical protein
MIQTAMSWRVTSKTEANPRAGRWASAVATTQISRHAADANILSMMLLPKRRFHAFSTKARVLPPAVAEEV